MSRLIKDALREPISRDPRSYQRDLRNEITRLSERRRGFIIDCRLEISFSQAFPRLDDRDETRLTVNQSFLRRPEANSQSRAILNNYQVDRSSTALDFVHFMISYG